MPFGKKSGRGKNTIPKEVLKDTGPLTMPTPGNPVFAPYVPGLAWDEQPSIRALWQMKPGDEQKTEYDIAHPIGNHGEGDKTSFVFGLAEVTGHHWPDIMYILRPPQERAKYAAITQVGKLKDEHNKTVYEKWPIEGKAPRALRALPGVPDQISSKEHWWFIELLRRVTPAVQMDDIIMRMMPDFLPRTTHGDKKVRNSMNMRASRRAYPAYFMFAWHGRGLDDAGRKHAARDKVWEALSESQRQNNTTRGKTPGLIDPTKDDEPENRIPLPELSVNALQRIFRGRGNQGIGKRRRKGVKVSKPAIKGPLIVKIPSFNRLTQSQAKAPAVTSNRKRDSSESSDNGDMDTESSGYEDSSSEPGVFSDDDGECEFLSAQTHRPSATGEDFFEEESSEYSLITQQPYQPSSYSEAFQDMSVHYPRVDPTDVAIPSHTYTLAGQNTHQAAFQAQQPPPYYTSTSYPLQNPSQVATETAPLLLRPPTFYLPVPGPTNNFASNNQGFINHYSQPPTYPIQNPYSSSSSFHYIGQPQPMPQSYPIAPTNPRFEDSTLVDQPHEDSEMEAWVPRLDSYDSEMSGYSSFNNNQCQR